MVDTTASGSRGSAPYLILPVIALLWLGCGKDVDRFIPDPVNPPVVVEGDIDRFFEAARTAFPHTATIDPAHPTPIVTARKSVFIFPTGSFIDQSGMTVSGPVNISIRELLTRGELLLYGISTHSYDELLVSGSEFYLMATQDGHPLTLRSGKPVRVLTNLQPGIFPNARMELFYDVPASTISPPPHVLTWIEADQDPATWSNVQIMEWAVVAGQQQFVEGYGYTTFTDSLGWMGLHAFTEIPSSLRTNLCITLPDAYTSENAAVFVVFNNIHAVLRLSAEAHSGTFCNVVAEDISVMVPVGASVTILAIAERGVNSYYLGISQTKISPDHTETIVPKPAGFQEILETIHAL